MNGATTINDIISNIECEICNEKFIKLSNTQYDNFCVKNKQLLPENFEDDNCCRIYEDRFECKSCKHKVCQQCYWSFKNHKYKPYIDDIGIYEAGGTLDDIGIYEAGGMLDDDVLTDGCPGEDCPIICPVCRTKDFKIYYGNKIPYELLHELKSNNRNVSK